MRPPPQGFGRPDVAVAAAVERQVPVRYDVTSRFAACHLTSARLSHSPSFLGPLHTHQLTAWLTLLAQLRGMACDVDGVAAQARVAKLAYWRALCYLVDRLPVHVFWDLLPQGMGTDTAVVAVAPSLSP